MRYLLRYKSVYHRSIKKYPQAKLENAKVCLYELSSSMTAVFALVNRRHIFLLKLKL